MANSTGGRLPVPRQGLGIHINSAESLRSLILMKTDIQGLRGNVRIGLNAPAPKQFWQLSSPGVGSQMGGRLPWNPRHHKYRAKHGGWTQASWKKGSILKSLPPFLISASGQGFRGLLCCFAAWGPIWICHYSITRQLNLQKKKSPCPSPWGQKTMPDPVGFRPGHRGIQD